MENLSLRPNDNDIEATVSTYSKMLFKLCFTLLSNNEDAEDAVSDVFCKYISSNVCFESEDHKKAWLLRVAANICKNMLKFHKIRRHISLEDAEGYLKSEDELSIFNQLFDLPVKYRVMLHLYYVEGYKTAEIAQMLKISPSAARKRLQYARDMLKIEYGKDELE